MADTPDVPYVTPPSQSTVTYLNLALPPSWGNALCACFFLLSVSVSIHGAVSGFLPVLYEYLLKSWRTVPEEASDSDIALAELTESQKLLPTQRQRLTGRRILLLWLPALCDLTGTTVRNFFFCGTVSDV